MLVVMFRPLRGSEERIVREKREKEGPGTFIVQFACLSCNSEEVVWWTLREALG